MCVFWSEDTGWSLLDTAWRTFDNWWPLDCARVGAYLCCFLKLCSIPPYLWMVLHCLWLRANISYVDRLVSAFLSFLFRKSFSLTFFIDATRELTKHKIRCRPFQWKDHSNEIISYSRLSCFLKACYVRLSIMFQ